jgi:hypothetical protein
VKSEQKKQKKIIPFGSIALRGAVKGELRAKEREPWSGGNDMK